MYIPKKPPAVRLISDTGDQWGFASLGELVDHYGLRWIERYVGPQFRVRNGAAPEHCPELPAWSEYSFILRDAEDNVVTAKDCEAFIYERYDRWRRERKVERRYPFKRVSPVPNIHRYSAGRHYFRAIRTFPSHRAAAAVIASEGEPPFRGRRSSQLPNAWDDIQLGSWRDKGWKRHRRAQWAPRHERGLRRRARWASIRVLGNEAETDQR